MGDPPWGGRGRAVRGDELAKQVAAARCAGSGWGKEQQVCVCVAAAKGQSTVLPNYLK